MSFFRPRAFLIDLSGTVHIDNSAIPGAVEAIKKLTLAKIPFMFVTNTTKESQRFLHNRFAFVELNFLTFFFSF